MENLKNRLEKLENKAHDIYIKRIENDKEIDKLIVEMEILETGTITYKRKNYEVVDMIPEGYEIWNIGANMVAGFLPIAIVNDFKVDTSTLKAVRCKDYKEIMYHIGGTKKQQDSVKHLYKHLLEKVGK